MPKILIRRSDGVAQHYKVSNKWIKSHPSNVELVEVNGIKRRRRIFGLILAESEGTQFEKYKGVPFQNVQHGGLTKVKEISTPYPIPNEEGQARVKIRAWKSNGQSITSEGRSYKRDASFSELNREKMKNEAFAMAYKLVPFSPDAVKVIYIDYVYFVPI